MITLRLLFIILLDRILKIHFRPSKRVCQQTQLSEVTVRGYHEPAPQVKVQVSEVQQTVKKVS